MSYKDHTYKARQAKIDIVKSILGLRSEEQLAKRLGYNNRKAIWDYKCENSKSNRVGVTLDLIIENYRLKNKLNTIWNKPKKAKVLGIKKIVFSNKSVEEQIELSVKG